MLARLKVDIHRPFLDLSAIVGCQNPSEYEESIYTDKEYLNSLSSVQSKNEINFLIWL